MKLRTTNQIELSYANAKALVQAFEERQRGHESSYPLIYKVIDGQTVSVSIVSDEEHYSEDELSARTSPYLPAEAWAGVR